MIRSWMLMWSTWFTRCLTRTVMRTSAPGSSTPSCSSGDTPEASRRAHLPCQSAASDSKETKMTTSIIRVFCSSKILIMGNEIIISSQMKPKDWKKILFNDFFAKFFKGLLLNSVTLTFLFLFKSILIENLYLVKIFKNSRFVLVVRMRSTR